MVGIKRGAGGGGQRHLLNASSDDPPRRRIARRERLFEDLVHESFDRRPSFPVVGVRLSRVGSRLTHVRNLSHNSRWARRERGEVLLRQAADGAKNSPTMMCSGHDGSPWRERDDGTDRRDRGVRPW